MDLNDIVKLWHKTQVGHINECKTNQLIFSGIMWTLYEKLKNSEPPEYQSTGDEII